MTAHTRPTETKTQTQAADPELIAIEAPFTIQRTETQRTARALYALGWNVFPVPRPHEVRAWATATGRISEINSKPPYTLRPVMTNRLYCSRGREFDELFESANLAVMTGRTSGNLAIIDADQNAQRVKYELDKRGLPYWHYKTGNGENFIIRILEGEVINIPAAKATIPGVEVWGHDHFCVLPPSVHYSGALYDWVNVYPPNSTANIEPIPATALDWLGVELRANAWENPELYGLPGFTILLSRKNRGILASVLVEGERNTKLTGPVYDLAAHVQLGDIDEGKALELLYQAGKRCEPPYSRRQIDTMWKSAINKRGLEPARKHEGKGRGYEIYNQARTFAAAHQWTGRTAQTDRAVFLACAERARIEGEVFSASIRNLAELANMTHQTVINALDRLRKAELLELISTDKERRTANEYRFMGVLNNTTKQQLVLNGVFTHTTSTPMQDVFSKLGRVALRCYEHLLQQPEPTITAIAQATGQNRSSVLRAINGNWKGRQLVKGTWQGGELVKPGLLAYGLVFIIQSEGLYMANSVTGQRLNEIAQAVGTLGKAAKRRDYHEKTRQIRTNKQIRWARERWARTIQRCNYETNEI
jgi:DNA-binding transcriptional ArsR family regulator